MEFKTLKISPKTAVLESVRAQTKLFRYVRDNNLESAKANLNHPIHGPIIKEYLRIIQYGNNKINELEQEIMKTKKEKKAKEKLANEVKVKKSDKKLKKPVVKVEPSKNRVFTIYDYPTIDGKELSSDLKKRYRAKIRSLIKSQMTKEEATKRATAFIKEESTKPKDIKKQEPDKESKPKDIKKQEPDKESKSKVGKSEKKDKVSKKKDLQPKDSSKSKKSKDKPKEKVKKEED